MNFYNVEYDNNSNLVEKGFQEHNILVNALKNVY